MEEFVLQRLDKLRHKQGDLRVIQHRQLLHSENPDFDVSELAIEQRQGLFRKHVFGQARPIEGVVANPDLLMIRKVNQSDEDWHLVDVVAVLQHFVNLEVLLCLFVKVHGVGVE